MRKLLAIFVLILIPVLGFAEEDRQEATFGKWSAGVGIDPITDSEDGVVLNMSGDDIFYPVLVKKGSKIEAYIITRASGFMDSPQNMLWIDGNKAHKIKMGPSTYFKGVKVCEESAPLGKKVLKELLSGKKVMIQVALYGWPEIPIFEVSLDGFRDAYKFLDDPVFRKKAMLKQE